MKNELLFLFLKEMSGFSVYPFERFDFQQPKFFFFLTWSYPYVIIDSLSLWTFHFLAGMICMIEDKTTKKTKWLYFGLARHTFITNDGYKIIEIVRTLS